MLPGNSQPNTNTPTLRFDSEGYVQIVLSPRPVPASATLIYVSARGGDAQLIALRLSLPGRRLYLIVNPSLPPHRAALKRLAGQRTVRIVDSAGIPLATVYQPEGARRHLSHLISEIPAPERPYNALDWAKLVADTQLKLPAAAEIPADLEGYQPG